MQLATLRRWGSLPLKAWRTRYKIASAYIRFMQTPKVSRYMSRRLISRHARGAKPSSVSKFVATLLFDHARHDAELTSAIASQFDADSSRYALYKAGDRLLQSREYTAIAEDFLRLAARDNAEINANFRYADYLTQAYGYAHRDLPKIVMNFRRHGAALHLTTAQRLRSAVIEFQLHEPELAQKHLESVAAGVLAAGNIPLYLQKMLVEKGCLSSPYVQRGARHYYTITEGREAFETALDAHKSNFCIVGNGPTEIGTGNGAIIDRRNFVIRINNYSLVNPVDYGSKQSAWARVPNSEADAPHLRNNEFLIVASNRYEYKRRDTSKLLLPADLSGVRFTTIPGSVYSDLIRELECLPSTGTAMIYWAYMVSGKIARSDLFGFSHFEEKADFISHYYKDTFQRKTHIHRWERESNFLRKIVA